MNGGLWGCILPCGLYWYEADEEDAETGDGGHPQSVHCQRQCNEDEGDDEVDNLWRQEIAPTAAVAATTPTLQRNHHSLFTRCGIASNRSTSTSSTRTTAAAAAATLVETATPPAKQNKFRILRMTTSGLIQRRGSSTNQQHCRPTIVAATTTDLHTMGATVSASTNGGNSGAAGENSCHHHYHHHHHYGQTQQQSSYQDVSGVTQLTQMGGLIGSASATSGLQTSQQQATAQAPPQQRRKKVTGFATLKKKFIRRRRSSKTCDHGRVLRDFVSDWNPMELVALLDEYEALAALKDLSVQAELARPPATTFKQDLCALYDFKHCTDCEIVFRGAVFPVHRALLSARCPYFRDLLAGCPGFGARICLELRSSPVDVAMFSSLLRYLYTGDLCPHDPSIDVNLLRRLGEDFGQPNPLVHDLRYLLETGDYADAALVFTSEGADYHRPDSGSSEYGFRPKLELPCHKAVLSARSPFFRNLIQRRTRSLDEHAERTLHVPARIVLDETVIPKRYARVLLHAIYLDTVDLTLILRGAGCGNTTGSLGEVQALTHTGRTRPTPLEEAMELYQIGRFLELDILAQGCEDLILEWLNTDTLAQVLKWGGQPHGSDWVYRQACHYLREEFAAISNSTVLHQLDKSQLISALQNNFLQASELEVLQAVLKWGEHELIRRMEDREPNLLSHTAHSVTRKGIKKRDLNDVELREILSELLPLVRIDHVLPPNSDVLTQAIRRGLVSTPPSHMIGDDRENMRVSAWIRGGGAGATKNHIGFFVRPRLFMPYYEEIKSLLEEHVAQHQPLDILRMRRARHLPDIPDTLYMVSRLGGGVGVGTSGVDVVAAVAALPTPDQSAMLAMTKREQKLRQSPCCQRALALPLSSRQEINRQVRLRVVREFNLPDAVAELLENAPCFCGEDGNSIANVAPQSSGNIGSDGGVSSLGGLRSSLNDHDNMQAMDHEDAIDMEDDCGVVLRGQNDDDDESTPPPSPACLPPSSNQQISNLLGYGRNMTFPRQPAMSHLPHHHNLSSSSTHQQPQRGYMRRGDLPSLVTEGEAMGAAAFMMEPPGSSSCSDGHLSDIMPDVAMATASLNQLQLGEGPSDSLQLDLGDGSSHSEMGTVGGAHSMQMHHMPPASPRNFHHHHHYMAGGGASSPYNVGVMHRPSMQVSMNISLSVQPGASGSSSSSSRASGLNDGSGGASGAGGSGGNVGGGGSSGSHHPAGPLRFL